MRDFSTYSEAGLRAAELTLKRALNFSYGKLGTPPPGADPIKAGEIQRDLAAIRAEQKRRQN